MNGSEVLSLLPWRYPFVMVDGVIECVPHERILAVRRVPADEPLAQGHEDGVVTLPAVMVLEGLSQSAALLFQLTHGRIEPPRAPMLGHLRATLHRGAHVGDTILYKVEVEKMTTTHGIFRGVAEVVGAALVEAELAFAVTEAAPWI